MSSVVKGWKESDGRLIYDCYAVSNHMGGLGGGHYTAYAKNAFDDKWYNFNDSSCSAVRGSPEGAVVSSAAYNLFYRRRDWHAANMKELDYDKLAQTPDMELLSKAGVK